MAGKLAELPVGPRITDHISLGVVSKTFPADRIHAVLAAAGRASERQRDLPAHVVVYYVMALALYMHSFYGEVLRCLLEGIQWLAGPAVRIKVAGKSAISQARTRLGWEPMKALHDEIVKPIGHVTRRGCGYRQWHLVSLDGSTLDVADEQANDETFGRPGASRGSSAFPQLRFVSLVENGTHVLFGTQMGPYRDSERRLAEQVLPALRPGMLCLADRYYLGYPLWQKALATGADLLWRARTNLRLKCDQRLQDGSYLSRIFPSEKDWRQQTRGQVVRVIEYCLDDVPDAETFYRLVTTLLDPDQAPACELAALYRERWEIETALDELKTHLRGARIVLRSKTPDLVRQEFWGLMMAHFAIRSLMFEAAQTVDADTDRLSYLHTIRVVRRKMAPFGAFPP